MPKLQSGLSRSRWPRSRSIARARRPRRGRRAGTPRRSSRRRRICGIRWTPEKTKLKGNSYYEWIVNGLHLYDVLDDLSADLVEVFPTASWTRWVGPRGLKTRARWTRQGLGQLEIGGLPDRRLNQDDRDAIAAALTAQQFSEGSCDLFGEIAVPHPR